MSQELERYRPPDGKWPALSGEGHQDRFSHATLWHAQVHRYLAGLRRRWWVFLVALLVIAGPVSFFAFSRPPAFQSQAVMWLAGQLKLPAEGFYAEELSSYIGTQAQLLKSAMIQWRAFEKVRAAFPQIALTATNAQPDRIPFALTVKASAKNSVLELSAKGPFPDATRAFLDAVMAEYLDFKRASRRQASAGALSGITEQIHGVERQIQEQQAQMSLFQLSNNLSYLTERSLTAGSHLSKLMELLSELRTEQRLLQQLTPNQFESLAQKPGGTGSDTIIPGEKAARALVGNNNAPQSAYYQALQQLQLLKARRDDFARVLRPAHSKMQKLNQEISGLEQLLATLQAEGEQHALAQMLNRTKSLQLEIENLESQYKDWETNAAEASRKLADYDRIKQDLQRSQALYDRLLGLLQTADLNTNLDQEPLAPLAPASAARPSLAKYRVMVEGIVLAMILGTAVFLVMEFLDDRFKSAREVSLHLPVEVVGQIPETRLDSAIVGRALVPTDAAFSESFRNLRSSLLFMSGSALQPRVILVTSAIPKEGKTTVATNLARTLARSGSRVLLVDADFRRGSLHRTFDVRRKPGLLNVLTQGIPCGQAIVEAGEPNLLLLPAGDAPDISSDVFLRFRADALLKDLAKQFDFVVIDSAPVLATDEAACLGPSTDGVFMVVRAAHTSSRMALEALERLRRRNVKVLGMIYNRAPESSDYYCQYTSDYYAQTEEDVIAGPGTTAPQDSQQAKRARSQVDRD